MNLDELSECMLNLPNEQFDIFMGIYRACINIPPKKRDSFMNKHSGFDRGLLEELIRADGRFREAILRELRQMGLKEKEFPAGPFFTYIRLRKMREDPTYRNFLYDMSRAETQDRY